jgi:hypothetical protein
MAHPSSEVNTIRDHFTRLSDDFMTLAVLLQRYQDFGANYYAAYLGTDEEPTTDITPTEFVNAVGVLATMAASLTSQQRLAIAKMRR